VPESATALVDRLLADPPAVHDMDLSPHPKVGLWPTDRDCYLLLAENTGPGTDTLETGSGLSTILFAGVGARHTCVTPAQVEVERILTYCADRGIETTSLTFEIGCSDDVLPRLPIEQSLDLVFIDGNHGFPAPMIDWYYAGSRLRAGGLLVIDDVALPAVAHLCAFLDRDPRWSVSRRTSKWVAYRRVTAGSLRQDWYEQPFYSTSPPRGLGNLPARAMRRVRAAWRHLRN